MFPLLSATYREGCWHQAEVQPGGLRRASEAMRIHQTWRLASHHDWAPSLLSRKKVHHFPVRHQFERVSYMRVQPLCDSQLDHQVCQPVEVVDEIVVGKEGSLQVVEPSACVGRLGFLRLHPRVHC